MAKECKVVRCGTLFCSYALHLLKSSWLPKLLYAISCKTNNLIIIGATNNPVIKTNWGWDYVDSIKHGKAISRFSKT
jgi:hypothetical protein